MRVCGRVRVCVYMRVGVFVRVSAWVRVTSHSRQIFRWSDGRINSHLTCLLLNSRVLSRSVRKNNKYTFLYACMHAHTHTHG